MAVVLALAVSGCATMGPASVEWLESLPLGDAGWSHSSQLNDLSHGAAVGLAANDNAVVALVGPRPEAFRSTDGLTWQTSEGFPETDLMGCPLPVAGGPLGFVAVGLRDTGADDSPDTPVVAFSSDGLRWEASDSRALPSDEVAFFLDVVAGADGFLVLGAQGQAEGSEDLFAWFSPDGRTWTASGLTVRGTSTAAAAGDGWVAITEDYTRISEPEIWTSSDGHTWSAVETVSAPAQAAVRAYCGAAPLAVLGDTWVLAAPEGSHDVIAWVSTDAGVTWTRQGVIDVPTGGMQRVHDLAVTPSGFVLTGWWDEEPDGRHTYVSYSTDGITWETASSTDADDIARIAAMGDTLILVGDEPETHVWTAP